MRLPRLPRPSVSSLVLTALASISLTAAQAGEIDNLGERSRDKLKALNAAIIAHPRSAQAYVDRAEFYNLAMMDEEAARDFDHALKLDPQCSDAYDKRGMQHLHQDEFKEAIADLLKAGSLAPPDKKGQAYRNAGRAQLKLRGYNDAVKTLTTAIQWEKPMVKHLSIKERATAYFGLGKYKECIADVDSLETLHPTRDDEALCVRAEAKMKLGQYEQAIPDLSRAIKCAKSRRTNFEKTLFSDSTSRYLKLRAECYKKTGQPALAENDLKRSNAAAVDAIKFAPFR
ncbi:MAG: tetratricopeptide repeat protein [Cyanobacteria bacterium SZAS TMP-1]|nr:tetratricopeptide repeat protein [Cyanobacteria bacterium SZAS TMP-1]